MKDILIEIVAHKRLEVVQQKEKIPFSTLEKQLPSIDFSVKSMKKALLQSDSGIIAEFKRKSPAKGWINQSADVHKIPISYAENGAAALSILTDNRYFGGTTDDLRHAAHSVQIPVMRKEFIVDEYQLVEAKVAGASAVLLIAAALSVKDCQILTRKAYALGLEVLLELHDEKEIDYITSQNEIIGINNRNLGTFVTDVEKSFRMIPRLPKEAVWVSESGISSPQIAKTLREGGYKGLLIGENFMKTDNPGDSLHTFIRQMQ